MHHEARYLELTDDVFEAYERLGHRGVIDRYLLAVRVFLPRAAQRDIITELSEDLRSRIEDREAGLGRRLTEDEQEGLVKEFGHPALLAGRYGPRRHLIGAEVFPFYWLVLKLALGVGVAVHVAVAVAMFAGGKTGPAIRQVTVILPAVAFLQFGVITIVFATLDAYGVLSRFSRSWRPHTLPAAVGCAQPLFQLAFTALFAAWWLAALREPFLILGPGALVVRLAPIWQSLYVWMVVLALADIALRAVDLFRPQWPRFRFLGRIAVCGFSLALLYVLARAGEWVVIADAARQSAGVRQTVEVLNQCFPWGFAFTAFILLGTMLPQLRMLRRNRLDASQTL